MGYTFRTEEHRPVWARNIDNAPDLPIKIEVSLPDMNEIPFRDELNKLPFFQQDVEKSTSQETDEDEEDLEQIDMNDIPEYNP